jgi:hypothetical protein
VALAGGDGRDAADIINNIAAATDSTAQTATHAVAAAAEAAAECAEPRDPERPTGLCACVPPVPEGWLRWELIRSKVGRCRLTVSKPALKARLVSALETKM